MFTCDSCEYAKHCRTSYPLNINKSTFKIVHFDVWGPIPIDSLFGYRYFVTFMDDHSRAHGFIYSNPNVMFFLSLFLIIR